LTVLIFVIGFEGDASGSVPIPKTSNQPAMSRSVKTRVPEEENPMIRHAKSVLRARHSSGHGKTESSESAGKKLRHAEFVGEISQLVPLGSKNPTSVGAGEQ